MSFIFEASNHKNLIKAHERDQSVYKLPETRRNITNEWKTFSQKRIRLSRLSQNGQTDVIQTRCQRRGRKMPDHKLNGSRFLASGNICRGNVLQGRFDLDFSAICRRKEKSPLACNAVNLIPSSLPPQPACRVEPHIDARARYDDRILVSCPAASLPEGNIISEVNSGERGQGTIFVRPDFIRSTGWNHGRTAIPCRSLYHG